VTRAAVAAAALLAVAGCRHDSPLVSRAKVAVTVRVLDGAGRPVTDASVTALSNRTRLLLDVTATPTSDGYVLALVPGEWHVEAASAGRTGAADVTVPATSPVVLTVR
jgi:hypothetical protein